MKLRVKGRPLGGLGLLGALSPILFPVLVAVVVLGTRWLGLPVTRTLYSNISPSMENALLLGAAATLFVGFWLATLVFLRRSGSVELHDEHLRFVDDGHVVPWTKVRSFSDGQEKLVLVKLEGERLPRGIPTGDEAERVAVLGFLDEKGVKRE